MWLNELDSRIESFQFREARLERSGVYYLICNKDDLNNIIKNINENPDNSQGFYFLENKLILRGNSFIPIKVNDKDVFLLFSEKKD